MRILRARLVIPDAGGAAIQDGTAAVRFLTGPKKLRSISAS